MKSSFLERGTTKSKQHVLMHSLTQLVDRILCMYKVGILYIDWRWSIGYGLLGIYQAA